jgi:uncharacterized coiled-coil protein SlyX
MPRDNGCFIACMSLLWLSPLCLGTAHAAEDPVTIQQLRSDLAEKDRALAAMQRRMDHLEQKVSALEQGQTPASSAADRPAQPPSDGQASSGPGARIGARTTASGDAAELEEESRALERALVVTGGLLLPRGAFEIQPTAEYAFARTRGLEIMPSASGAVALAVQDVRSQSVAFGATARMGLPLRSQFELSVPLVYQHIKSNTGGVVRSTGATGLGDLQATLSKQILPDRGWRPGLIGSVSYKTPTASSKLVNLGASTLGFEGVGIGLTAVKRHDPLVFFGGYSHVAYQADRRSGVKIKPGDIDSVHLGGILAVSPDVSLRMQFLVEHSREFKQNGQRQAGLGFTAGIVSFGGSMSLSETTVLDIELGAGVTQGSPDFTAAVSLPIRF